MYGYLFKFLEMWLEDSGGTAVGKKLTNKIFGSFDTKGIQTQLKSVNRSFGGERIPRMLKKKHNEMGMKVLRNIKNLDPKEMKELMKPYKQGFKPGEGEKKGKESDMIQILFNYDGEYGLSSSFLQYGVFISNKKDAEMGRLILAMSGKEYDFKQQKSAIWAAMVKASGKNGTGAGSVLWNTIWYSKRKLSKITGGISGSKKALQKNRSSQTLMIARFEKHLKNYRVNRKGYVIKKAPAANIAKIAKMAKTPKGFKIK